MTVKVGIIGCGSIARKRHLPELAAHPGVKIEAVCDIVEQRAQEMKDIYGGKVFTDYMDLISMNELDTVYICATNVTHAKMTIEALKAGKHVLCEKPMATSLKDAQDMIKTAEESGRFLMIGHNQRLAPAHIKAKEILKSGRLGKVITFRTTFGHRGCEYWAIDKGSTWFFDKEFAHLGCMGDLGIHKADLMRWLLNEEFVEVSASTGILGKKDACGNPITVEDNAICMLKGSSGTMGTLVASWTYKSEDNSTVLYCEKGVMRIYADPEYQIVIDFDDGTTEYHKIGRIQTNDKQSKSGITDLFINCILNNRKPEISGVEGYEALKIVLACMESAEMKKVIKIN